MAQYDQQPWPNQQPMAPPQPPVYPPQQAMYPPQQWIRTNDVTPRPPVPGGYRDWVAVAGFTGARPFRFDGGAGSYLGISILSFLLTVFTFGIAAPWAICMRYRWQAEHTLVYERRVNFTGTGMGLFGNWIKWLLLCFITLGIYSFWVTPRLTRWIVEHQDFRRY